MLYKQIVFVDLTSD